MKLNLIFFGILATGLTYARDVTVQDGHTIAFLGDSITAAGDSYSGYCRLVIQGLKAKGIRAKGIFAGVPGNKSSDMLLRLDAVLDQKPDVLFLSCGVNDIWHGDPTVKIGVFQAKEPGMGVSLEHYKLYVTRILDRCQAAGAQVMAKGILKLMGFSNQELTDIQNEWTDSPRLLVLGDRQVFAGGRTGGWCHMLLDGMNSGRELVTHQTIGIKAGTVRGLLSKFEISGSRIRYMVLIPPLGDLSAATGTEDYQEALHALIEQARRLKIKCVMTTIPMLDGDPDSVDNKQRQNYNTVIRLVCKETKTPLADISAAMQAYYAAHPGARLTVGDERLNHRGGTLLAETILKAFGGYDDQLPELRKIWDCRSSYTFRYGSSVTFTIPFSTEGNKVLEDISKRYHHLKMRSFYGPGIHALLHDGPALNQQRLDYAEAHWFTQDKTVKPAHLRMAPASAHQARVIAEYIDKAGIDWPTFYRRAFQVGMHIIVKEDPLGRGLEK